MYVYDLYEGKFEKQHIWQESTHRQNLQKSLGVSTANF